MSLSVPQKWDRFAGVLIGLSSSLVILSADSCGGFERLELLSLDLRQRMIDRPLVSDLLIVDIDHASVKELGWPVPRGLYANLIHTAAEHGARSIGVDVLFADAGRDEGCADGTRQRRRALPAVYHLAIARNAHAAEYAMSDGRGQVGDTPRYDARAHDAASDRCEQSRREGILEERMNPYGFDKTHQAPPSRPQAWPWRTMLTSPP